MRTAEQVLTTLLEQGTQHELLDRMQTRTELYDLLGYSDWERRDQAYFTGGTSGTESQG
jgi:methylisocitrate lyase